jgi:hypothetical protein
MSTADAKVKASSGSSGGGSTAGAATPSTTSTGHGSDSDSDGSVRRSGRKKTPSLGAIEAFMTQSGLERAEFIAAVNKIPDDPKKKASSSSSTARPVPLPSPSPSAVDMKGLIGALGGTGGAIKAAPTGAHRRDSVTVSTGDHHVAAGVSTVDESAKVGRGRRHTRSHSHSVSRSSSRDGSESDDEEKRHPPLYYRGVKIKSAEQWSPSMQSTVLEEFYSFRDWASANRCTNPRNRFEVDHHCAVIDALRKGQINVALELITRRIVGVTKADENGDWSVCTTLDLNAPGKVGTAALWRQLDKDISKAKARSAVGARGSHSRGGGEKKGKGSHRGGRGSGQRPTAPLT